MKHEELRSVSKGSVDAAKRGTKSLKLSSSASFQNETLVLVVVTLGKPLPINED